MKAMIEGIFGRQREKQIDLDHETWFNSLTTIVRHLSHISPAMNFESFARHVTDAICQGLAPLQPIAAHFHIDVSVSHLWLPDPSFKLDVFFRVQNRILMPSQTRPVETSREDLFRTHVVVPFEMHKHAIELLIYHKEDNSGPVQLILQPLLEAFSRAITQAMLLREEHLMLKETWEKQAEKVLGNRLTNAIYQTQTPLIYAQSMRLFNLPSASDASEKVFLNHNQTLDIYRFIFLKVVPHDPVSSSSRTIALFSSLAAQLRYFEHTTALTSFNDLLQYFSQSLASLSHLMTSEDKVSFVVGEFSQKNAQMKWHAAGMPEPFLFGKTADSIVMPKQQHARAYNVSMPHDWTVQTQFIMPVNTGVLFITENVIQRLNELNLSLESFYDRLRQATHAANVIIEAERLLSKPDSSRVVSASVTDWNKLPFDISLVAMFNNGAIGQPPN